MLQSEEKFYMVEEQMGRTYDCILKKMEYYFDNIKKDPYDESSRETLLSFGDVMIEFLKNQISVYYNLCPNKQWAETKINRLEELMQAFNAQLELDSQSPGKGK